MFFLCFFIRKSMFFIIYGFQLSTESVSSRRELVANCVHAAEATQLDSWVASAVCIEHNVYLDVATSVVVLQYNLLWLCYAVHSKVLYILVNDPQCKPVGKWTDKLPDQAMPMITLVIMIVIKGVIHSLCQLLQTLKGRFSRCFLEVIVDKYWRLFISDFQRAYTMTATAMKMWENNGILLRNRLIHDIVAQIMSLVVMVWDRHCRTSFQSAGCYEFWTPDIMDLLLLPKFLTNWLIVDAFLCGCVCVQWKYKLR